MPTVHAMTWNDSHSDDMGFTRAYEAAPRYFPTMAEAKSYQAKIQAEDTPTQYTESFIEE